MKRIAIIVVITMGSIACYGASSIENPESVINVNIAGDSNSHSANLEKAVAEVSNGSSNLLFEEAEKIRNQGQLLPKKGEIKERSDEDKTLSLTFS